MARRSERAALRRAEVRSARRVERWLNRLLRGRDPEVALAGTEERRAAVMGARLRALATRDPAPSEAFTASLLGRLRQERTSAADGGPAVARQMTRRGLVGAFAAGAVLTAAVAFAGRLWQTGIRRPHSGLGTGRLARGQQGRWVQVGLAERFPPGTVAAVMAGGAYVFIVGRPAGPLALSGLCTDVGCPLQFARARQQLVCPCHGAEFGLDGTPVPRGYWAHLPSLTVLPIRVVEGQVEIQPPGA